MRAGSILVLASLALLAVPGAGGCKLSRDGRTVPTLALHECRPHGAGEEVRCGTFETWENRTTKSGKKIALNVAVVPALSTSPAPDPVFFLAGGPGQGAADIVALVMPMLEKLNRRHDIVLIDQRGTGASNPLKCTGEEDAGLGQRLREGVDDQALRRCLAGLVAGGTDPSQYTTTVAMDDLDDVRAALGYGSIDLMGGSYGTRAALSYLRQHPDHVRSVVLDGVDPPSMSLVTAAAENAERAFDKVFHACAVDAACAEAFPHPRAELEALLAELEINPAHVTLPHPTTGAPSDVVITRDSFLVNLHGLLYKPEIAALLPLIVHRARLGDFTPFAAQAVTMGAMGDHIAEGMFFSVVCAEDAPPATPAEVEAHAKGTLFGQAYARSLLSICSFWPKGTVPAGYHDPVASDVPVLLLSGDLDPVTPPSRADEARVKLTHATSVVVPNTGHNTAMTGCVPQIISKFVEQGSADGLDTRCVEDVRPPPFFVTFAGPKP